METNTFDKSDLSSYYGIDAFFLYLFLVSSSPWWALSAEKTKVSDLGKSMAQRSEERSETGTIITAFHIDSALFIGVSLGFRGCDKPCSVQVEEMLKLQI